MQQEGTGCEYFDCSWHPDTAHTFTFGYLDVKYGASKSTLRVRGEQNQREEEGISGCHEWNQRNELLGGWRDLVIASKAKSINKRCVAYNIILFRAFLGRLFLQKTLESGSLRRITTHTLDLEIIPCLPPSFVLPCSFYVAIFPTASALVLRQWQFFFYSVHLNPCGEWAWEWSTG